MQPSGASLELPEGRWGGWYFERSELDKVKRGKWGVVYGVREDSEGGTAI